MLFLGSIERDTYPLGSSFFAGCRILSLVTTIVLVLKLFMVSVKDWRWCDLIFSFGFDFGTKLGSSFIVGHVHMVVGIVVVRVVVKNGVTIVVRTDFGVERQTCRRRGWWYVVVHKTEIGEEAETKSED